MDDNEEEWRLQFGAEGEKGALPDGTDDSGDAELYRLLFTILAEMPDEPFVPVENAVVAKVTRKLKTQETREFWVGSVAIVLFITAISLAAVCTINGSFASRIYHVAADYWRIALFVAMVVAAIQVVEKKLARLPGSEYSLPSA